MKTVRLGVGAILVCGLLATEPNEATRRWWSHVQALANDSLAGRDTGSEGYRKAAAYVVDQLQRAGLKPAGEKGWYQSVPLHVVKLRTDESSAELVRASGTTKLGWLQQITVPARKGAPESVEGALVFEGDTSIPAEERGSKIPVRMRRGTGGRGAVGGGGVSVNIDPTGGPEPPRWPVAYSVTMTLADVAAPAGTAFRFNPASAEELFQGSGHTYKELTELAAAGKPLPTFPLNTTLRARMKFEESDLRSDNVIGVLPGSDPALASEYVIVSAHLDGYGIGEPWNGDRIYNGAFDDAAYVATLIDFAERLHESGKHLN